MLLSFYAFVVYLFFIVSCLNRKFNFDKLLKKNRFIYLDKKGTFAILQQNFIFLFKLECKNVYRYICTTY